MATPVNLATRLQGYIVIIARIVSNIIQECGELAYSPVASATPDLVAFRKGNFIARQAGALDADAARLAAPPYRTIFVGALSELAVIARSTERFGVAS